jgi:aspartyl aminopeptidase
MKINAEIMTAANSLIDFLNSAPSPWHVVETMRQQLSSAGFTELKEIDEWKLETDGAYFVVRNESSMLAFICGSDLPEKNGFNIIGAHTDSPALRVKINGEHEKSGMVRLGVELYGGPIVATWTDRDLSLAGRVTIRDKDAEYGVRNLLFDVGRAIVRVPNAAIHLNREVNSKGLLLDKQNNLPLLLAGASSETGQSDLLLQLIANELAIDADKIMSYELNAVDVQPAALYGLDNEFIAAGRLDNLASTHSALLALIDKRKTSCPQTRVIALWDNEETGSQTLQGARGNFLASVLERIVVAQKNQAQSLRQAIAQSFLISADLAHAVHPNYSVLHDANHQIYLNRGPVVKVNANQNYTSNSYTDSRFAVLCEKAGSPCQRYIHRSDLPCGSTIGPMTSAAHGIHSVDVGNACFSMHSIRECMGAFDQWRMNEVLKEFFTS